MTVQELALELYRDMGITTLTPANDADNQDTRGPSTGDPEAIVNAINGAAEELWREAPNSLFQRRWGAVLRAPTTVSVTVTQYSTTVTVTTYAAWMQGCTINLGGDTNFNELVSSTLLSRPYMGSTGTVTGTVYADCVPLTEANQTGFGGINTILSPVILKGYAQLMQVNDRDELTWRAGESLVWTPHTTRSGTPPIYQNKPTGTPRFYFPDTENKSAAAYSSFIRLSPMPDTASMLEFNSLIGPPVYDVEDIDNGDHLSDPGTDIILPFSLTFLTAVARQRITGNPRFVNATGKEEIMRGYKKAIESMGDLRPSGISGNIVEGNPIYRG